MNDKDARITVFDRETRKYDAWFDRHKKWFEAELSALRELMPDTDAYPKGLEAGTGTGRFASALGIDTGLEPAENMAQIARERGIYVVNGVAEQMPFPDASFELVLMVTVDCFLQDILKAFSETFRVLKPGGRFIVGMINRESPFGQQYIAKQPDDPFYRHAKLHSVEEITNSMQEAGFRNPEYRQTLRNTETEQYELPAPGYQEGGFVAIKMLK